MYLMMNEFDHEQYYTVMGSHFFIPTLLKTYTIWIYERLSDLLSYMSVKYYQVILYTFLFIVAEKLSLFSLRDWYKHVNVNPMKKDRH